MMKPYREYKEINLPWLKEIPKHWNMVRAKYLFKKEERLINKSDDTITCFRDGVVTLRKNRRTNGFTESIKEIGYQGIKKGDLVIHGMDAFAGAIGVSDSDGKGSPVYSVCSPKEDTNQYYYAYLLRDMAKKEYIQSLSRGIRERSSDFRFNVFANLYLPVPTYKEQNQIVRYLDYKISKINKHINIKKKEAELFKELKQALITKAVTKGIDKNVKMKDSGVEWIGKIPEDWKISRIKYVALLEPSCDTTNITNDSIITYTPMEFIKNGFYIPNVAKFGTLSKSLTSYENGDIVIAKVTPCFENGNIAIMNNLSEGYGLGSSELFVIRSESINRNYLFYWLQNSIFKQQACATMTGVGGLKRVSSYFLSNCPIQVPQMDTQLEIVEYLNKKCDILDKLVSEKENIIEKLEEYKKSLIYECVTGKKEIINSE